MFTGNVFALDADTEYECRWVTPGPEGVGGENEQHVTVRTRPSPERLPESVCCTSIRHDIMDLAKNRRLHV